jgi:CheY-like chemotaxis protein
MLRLANRQPPCSNINKGLALECHCDDAVPERLAMDVGKLRQIVINLLSNALKFTDRGHVIVRASLSAAGAGAKLRITVEDTGCGMPPAFLGRVFDPFEQSSVGAAAGGTGLGMAISRNHARLMGGELTVESELQRGSRFILELPAVSAATSVRPELKPEAMQVPLALAPEQTPPRILVVDDVAANRELLAELLVGVGFTVKQAAGGEEALRAHDAWHPDLVLMDLQMPEIDGIEVTRRLRAMGSRVRIVAVSAGLLDGSKDEAKKAGADGFLAKPVDHSLLFETIDALLGIRYLYEPPLPASRPALDQALLRLQLEQLPSELREQLKAAALDAHPKRLHELVDTAAGSCPEVGAPLRALIDDFAYDTLVAVLDASAAGA